MFNPHQNGMFPQSAMNLPSMANLQQNQMQGQPRFSGNGVPVMMGGPGFPPQQFVQPVYIMDHQNQIHLINVQNFARPPFGGFPPFHQQQQMHRFPGQMMPQQFDTMSMASSASNLAQQLHHQQQQQQQHHQHHQQQLHQMQQQNLRQHHAQLENRNLQRKQEMQSRMGMQQQMAQMAQKAKSPHSNPGSAVGDSGHCSGNSGSRSTNVPNSENPAFAALNNMFTLAGGNVHEFSLNQGVPQPMNDRHPTNMPSKNIQDEEHSMIIEANGNSVRLNVKKNQGKIVHADVEPVPDWTHKVEARKPNEGSDDEYLTEDELEIPHKTKVQQGGQRIVQTGAEVQRILEQSINSAMLHTSFAKPPPEQGTFEETRSGLPSNTSIKRRRSNLSNRSINCSNYGLNPGGKAKKRRTTVRNLVSLEKMKGPVNVIPERSATEEVEKSLNEPSCDSAPSSSTPKKRIVSGERCDRESSQNSNHVQKAPPPRPVQNPASSQKPHDFQQVYIQQAAAPIPSQNQQDILTWQQKNLGHEPRSRQIRNKNGASGRGLDRRQVNDRRPRLGSGTDMKVKPTSAAALLRSQQNRQQGNLGMRRASQFNFPQMAVYNTGKPSKIDRTITCGEGTFHVSVMNAPNPEEMSSDTKKKNSLQNRISKAFRKNFSTGFKNKQTKTSLPPDASNRLRSKTREMKHTMPYHGPGTYEDPAIIRASQRPSTSKIRPQHSSNKLPIQGEKR